MEKVITNKERVKKESSSLASFFKKWLNEDTIEVSENSEEFQDKEIILEDEMSDVLLQSLKKVDNFAIGTINHSGKNSKRKKDELFQGKSKGQQKIQQGQIQKQQDNLENIQQEDRTKEQEDQERLN